MFGSLIGCDTNQKAPFITKRGRFELIRNDLYKRRLSFTVFDQQAFFWIDTRKIGLIKNRLLRISAVSTNEKEPLKRKRIMLTINNKRRLFNK